MTGTKSQVGRPMPTQDRLRELFDYDEHLGVLIWKVSRGGVKPGKVAGSKMKNGYVQIRVDGANRSAHVLVWIWMTGKPPIRQIDHKNGVRSDNSWENLRCATGSQNNQNQRGPRSDSTTGYLGVSYHKNIKRYVAHIKVPMGKKKHIGTFATAEEAHQAYVMAKRELHEYCEI